MAYTVKVVANFAGVSVRTLHHYDEIGLLKPAEVSPSGYRLYADSDLEKLQQILFFKELGFNLQEIKAIMHSPDYDKQQALHSHRQLLIEKKARIEELIQAVDKTIESMERGIIMDKKDMFGAFDESKMEEYKQEVREKYCKELVDECEEKTSAYTKKDWNEVVAEGEKIQEAIAVLMDRSPEDSEVQKLIAAHHKYINDKFYTCTAEIYSGLADLYVSDSRFTAYYEKIKPGLAQYIHDAMKVYVANLDGNA